MKDKRSPCTFAGTPELRRPVFPHGRSSHVEASPLGEMEQGMKLLTIFTTICRWLQVFNQGDTSWIKELHAQLHQVNAQS
jgi:hypothetical protein